MNTQDPIARAEQLVKDAHNRVTKHTEPALKKYPLVFAFLTIFGAAAILHGFELWSDGIPLFKDHPTTLILVGAFILLLTGRLYNFLDKNTK